MKANYFDQFADIIVPHETEIIYLKSRIENGRSRNPSMIFEDGFGACRFRDNRNLTAHNPTFLKYALYDNLQDFDYLTNLTRITSHEILWHVLSVYVGNYDIANMRNHLTAELSDNPHYTFNLTHVSYLFDATQYCVFSASLGPGQSLGLVRKSMLPQLILCGHKIGYEIRELRNDN